MYIYKQIKQSRELQCKDATFVHPYVNNYIMTLLLSLILKFVGVLKVQYRFQSDLASMFS